MPWQQPAQLLLLHTHAPFTHARPAPQAALVPQVHTPPAQRSATSGLQALHTPPWFPHVLSVAALHTLPAQQPPGQVVLLHTHAPLAQR